MTTPKPIHTTLTLLTLCAVAAGGPDDPAWKGMERAIVHLNDEQPERALEVLDGVKDAVRPPDQAAWWQLRGEALLRQGRDEGAREAFDQAVTREPRSLARAFRAVIHLRAGRDAEAVADADACGDDTVGADGIGRVRRIRAAAHGPFRARWPHAWPRLECRSVEGHYHLRSNLGVSDAEMDRVEAQAAKLDPARPEDQRRLETLLKPPPQLAVVAAALETIRREMLAALGLPEKDWPADRVCRVLLLNSEADVSHWIEAGGLPLGEGWFEAEAHVLVARHQAGPPTSAGVSEPTLRSLVGASVDQLIAAYAPRLPRWLADALRTCLAECRATGRGARLRIELGLLEQAPPDVKTRHVRVKQAVEFGRYRPWTVCFRTTSAEHAKADLDTWVLDWAIAYYLLKGRNADFRARWDALLGDMRAGKGYASVVGTHFPPDALDTFERAWLGFCKKF